MNTTNSGRHLTQLNMPEVCLEKEKFAEAAKNDEWLRLNTFSCSLPSWITFQMK